MDDDANRLMADMARLSARPYSEVGVPMILLAEDLRDRARPACGRGDAALAEHLRAAGQALGEPGRTLSIGEVARAVEVVADRQLLAPDGPDFTRLAKSKA